MNTEIDKKHKFNMSQFQNLPDEIILKVLGHLKVKDLLSCGQLSKRIRAISHDKSLYQKINLDGKKVRTTFLEKIIIYKGCKDLSLSRAQLVGSDFNLKRTSQLRSLNLDFCNTSVRNLEILTDSCTTLEKLSMRKLTKIFLSSNMIKNICNQNGQTLQVLNLENCLETGGSLSPHQVLVITKKCVVLKEVNFNKTGLYYDSVELITNNLTPSVQHLSLRKFIWMQDWDIVTLVKRCNQIRFLDLTNTGISNSCLPEIFRNLKDSLEELNFQTHYFYYTPHESYAEFFGLKFLTRFKTLHIVACGFMEKRLKQQLPGVVIHNKETDGKYCCTTRH